MLKRGNERIDFSNPKTDVDRMVAKRIKEIKEKYGLSSDTPIKFVYPARLVSVSKHELNKGRIESPASVKIRLTDIVREPTGGAAEWRYFETETPVKDGFRYSPDYIFFSGDLVLTENNIDLVYFLLDICSRMEGGKNTVPGKTPYIAVDNTLEKAENFEKTMKNKTVVESAIYGDEGIALGEEAIRTLALAIGIIGYETASLPMLRKQCYDIMMKDVTGSVKRIAEIKAGDKYPEMLALVNELNDSKLIIVEGSGPGKKTKAWHFFEKGTAGDPIMALSGAGGHIQQLAKLLVKDEKLADGLKSVLEEHKANFEPQQ